MSQEDPNNEKAILAALNLMRKEMNAQFESIISHQRKLERMIARLENNETPNIVPSAVFEKMSTKMHVAAQMLVAGKSNRDIGNVLGVSEEGAKTHVRSVAKRVEAKGRGQMVAKLIPLFDAIPPADYLAASGGLPKDWAETPEAGTDSDPYRELYRD